MKKKLILPLLSGLAIVPIAVVSCTDDTNITSRKNQNGQSGNNQQEQPDPSKPNTDGNGSGSNQTTPPPATKPESPKTPETPQPPAKPEDPKTPETPQPPAKPEDPKTPETPQPPAKPEDPKAPETKPESPKTPETPQPPAKPEDPKAPETKPETPEPPAKPQEPEKKVVDKKLVFDTAKKLLKFLNKQKELLTTLTSAEKLKSLSLDSYSKEKEFEELSKLDQEFLKFYAENKYIFESDVALNELKFAPIKTDEWINNALPSVKIAKKLISSVDELKAIKNEYFTKISQIAKDGQARIDSLKQVVGVAKKGYEWLTEGFDLKKENHKDVEVFLSSIYQKIFENVKKFEDEIKKPKEEKPIDLKHVLISKEEVEDWIKNQEIYSVDKRIKNLSYFNGRTFDSTSSYKIFNFYVLGTVDGSSNVQFTSDTNKIYKRTDYLAEYYYSPLQSNNRINAYWAFQWREVTKSKETNGKTVTVHTRTAGENKFDKVSFNDRDDINKLSKLQIMHDLNKTYIRVSFVNVKNPEKPNSNYKPIEKKVEPKKPNWRLVTIREISDFVKEVKKYSPDEQLRRATQFGHVTFENTTAVKIFTDFLKELLKGASVAYIDQNGKLLERKDYKFEEYYYTYKDRLANAHLVVQWTHSKVVGEKDDQTYWFHRRLKGTEKVDLEFKHWVKNINKRHDFPEIGPDHHYIWFNYYINK